MRKIQFNRLTEEVKKSISESKEPVNAVFEFYWTNSNKEKNEIIAEVLDFLADQPSVAAFKINVPYGLDIKLQQKLANLLTQNKNIKSLGIQTAEWDSPDSTPVADAIKSNTSLQTLRINSLGQGDAALTCLRALLYGAQTNLSLTTLDISGYSEIAPQLSMLLEHNFNIQNLRLDLFDLSNPSTVSDLTRRLGMLRHLKLNYCSFTPESFELFCEAENVRALESLNFNMLAQTVRIDIGGNIASLLRNNPKLKHLAVIDAGINSAGLKMIADAMQSNSTLESLDLSKNLLAVSGNEFAHEFHDEGMLALCAMLASNSTLKTLHLARCFTSPLVPAFSPVAIQALANALRSNKTLENLNLFYNNQSGDARLTPLLEAVATNQALLQLHMSYSDINPGALAAMIRQNSTLQRLTFTNLGEQGYDIVIPALETNHTITHMTDGRTDEQAARVTEILKRNRQEAEAKATQVAEAEANAALAVEAAHPADTGWSVSGVLSSLFHRGNTPAEPTAPSDAPRLGASL